MRRAGQRTRRPKQEREDDEERRETLRIRSVKQLISPADKQARHYCTKG